MKCHKEEKKTQDVKMGDIFIQFCFRDHSSSYVLVEQGGPFETKKKDFLNMKTQYITLGKATQEPCVDNRAG